MGHQRLTASPVTAAASGTGAVAVAVGAGLAGGYLAADDVATVAVVGLAGILGATGATLWARLVNRKAVGDIDQAFHSARHDTLTGLINRAELHRELRQSLDRGARDRTVVGVLFLDLNRFKAVNDTLGHDAGDELLKAVAGRLRATIRSTDVAARLGGDEFVVVCRDLLVGDSVLNVASQLQRRFREPVSLGSVMHKVGASIGIAIAGPGDERSPDDLLRDADTAMYKAKREHRPYEVFTDSHRSDLIDRTVVEQELARALEEEQFVVFYQPIVDVAGGGLVGFEALLRWRHPDRGLIEPRDFLTIADGVGLMAPIGRLVFREACAQMAVWTHLTPAARGLRVSLNLAEQQLTDPNLALEIEELLSWSGLDPGQIMVEVSESMIARHLEDLDALRLVGQLGVGVAIDGFGTGGISFSQARSLDMVSLLKIDRSFVREILHDPVARASVEAIVAMARSFGLDVMAEGVEEAAQADLLDQLGVQRMQGYLFNAPDYAEMVDPGSWFQHGADAEEASVGFVPVTAGR